MKNESLYRKTVDILYDAYFNDTLVHYNPCGCAVGNLVAANMGLKIIECDLDLGGIMWSNGIYGTKVEWMKILNLGWVSNYQLMNNKEGADQLYSTGYLIEEIRLIEIAFEEGDYSLNKEEWIFNGLVSVLETLKKIHEVEDNEPELKRFTNHYKNKELSKI